MLKGIIVGADQNLEWLLPWWWEKYSESNSLPVVFFDFGMSAEKKAWCAERGQVVDVDMQIPDEYLPHWQDPYGESYKKARKAWFKKPIACFLSPFDHTIWIDLDCEVLDSLEPAFSFLEEKEVAVTFGPIDIIPEGLERAVKAGTVCNSGVVVFKKGSSIIEVWKERSLVEAASHWGDDCLLSDVLIDHRDKVSVLSDLYNWRISRGLPLHAKVIHWCGEWGKECIAKNGGLKKKLDEIKRSTFQLFDTN